MSRHSHHVENSKSPSAGPLDTPGSPSSVGHLNVTYSGAADMDTPTSPSGISKAPATPGTSSIEVDGPNTPNPTPGL